MKTRTLTFTTRFSLESSLKWRKKGTRAQKMTFITQNESVTRLRLDVKHDTCNPFMHVSIFTNS